MPLLVADVYSLKLDEVVKEEAGLPGGAQLDDIYASGGGGGGGGGAYPPDSWDLSGVWVLLRLPSGVLVWAGAAAT